MIQDRPNSVSIPDLCLRAGPQPTQDGSVSVGGFLASMLAEDGMSDADE